MPRSSKVEACMICGEVPCGCFVKAAPKKRTTPSPVDAPIEEIRRAPSAVQVAMRAAAADVRREKFVRQYLSPPAPRRGRQTSDPDDLVLADAIRVLGDIMHPEEKQKYTMILTSEPSLDERAAAWRVRNGNHTHS